MDVECYFEGDEEGWSELILNDLLVEDVYCFIVSYLSIIYFHIYVHIHVCVVGVSNG